MWYNVPLIGEQMEEISKMSIISLKIINNHLALKVAMSKISKRSDNDTRSKRYIVLKWFVVVAAPPPPRPTKQNPFDF